MKINKKIQQKAIREKAMREVKELRHAWWEGLLTDKEYAHMVGNTYKNYMEESIFGQFPNLKEEIL